MSNHELHIIVDTILYEQLCAVKQQHGWSWGDFLRASLLLHGKAQGSQEAKAKHKPKPTRRRV